MMRLMQILLTQYSFNLDGSVVRNEVHNLNPHSAEEAAQDARKAMDIHDLQDGSNFGQFPIEPTEEERMFQWDVKARPESAVRRQGSAVEVPSGLIQPILVLFDHYVDFIAEENIFYIPRGDRSEAGFPGDKVRAREGIVRTKADCQSGLPCLPQICWYC
eukprot:768384-Hanusia_phi.AAC.3